MILFFPVKLFGKYFFSPYISCIFKNVWEKYIYLLKNSLLGVISKQTWTSQMYAKVNISKFCFCFLFPLLCRQGGNTHIHTHPKWKSKGSKGKRRRLWGMLAWLTFGWSGPSSNFSLFVLSTPALHLSISPLPVAGLQLPIFFFSPK